MAAWAKSLLACWEGRWPLARSCRAAPAELCGTSVAVCLPADVVEKVRADGFSLMISTTLGRPGVDYFGGSERLGAGVG